MKAQVAILGALLMSAPLIVESAAGPCTTRSGPQKNVLIELYTSEGCSSCPPADRWLSTLVPTSSQPQIVPINFHINYWDDIGWKDAYADPRFSARQRALAVAAHRPNVYTPQVILDGRDFPQWRGSAVTPAIRAISEQPARATMQIEQQVTTGMIEARVRVNLDRGITGTPTLFVAVTENDLSSRVTAGENRGAYLRHQHVARDLAAFPLRGSTEVPVRFELKPDWRQANIRVVAFVQNEATGEVLQALASCGITAVKAVSSQGR